MVGLLILKHPENLSDAVLRYRWVRAPYQHALCGEMAFQWEFPSSPSGMTYFQKRIGPMGSEKMFSASTAQHGELAIEEDMCIGTSAQEWCISISKTDTKKHIAFSSYTKQYRKIHGYLFNLACAVVIHLPRTHEKGFIQNTRFASHLRNCKKVQRAFKRLKTIMGRLLREIQRQMNETQQQKQQNILNYCQRVLKQNRGNKNKIYSLRESNAYNTSKGKGQKKYKFGTKDPVAKTRDTNVLFGALSVEENRYDVHALLEGFSQVERILGHVPNICLGGRDYRGKIKVDNTWVHIPKPLRKNVSAAIQNEMRKRFQRCAAIEPEIGYLKSGHRLNHNFLKAFAGDQINLLMAATFDFKKWMREVYFWRASISQVFSWEISPVDQWQDSH